MNNEDDKKDIFEEYFDVLRNGGVADVDDDFIDDIKPRKRLRPIKSAKTIQNHMLVLIPFKEWLDGRQPDKDAFKNYLQEIRKHTFDKNGTKQHYSKGTIYHIYSVLKRFGTWLDPDIGARIRVVPAEKKNVDVLKQEDVELLIEKGCATGNNRDRALVAFLWESGCRRGELRNIKIKDIEEISDGGIGDNGIRVKVNGKTGERPLKLIECYSYLRQWLAVHPNKNDPEAPLFCSTHPPYSVFSNCGIKAQLAEIGIRAGFPPERRIHPHLFRHSRASYLANYFTEAQLNLYFGWKQGSNQASTYVHMSGRDVEKAVDGLHGLSNAKPEQTVIKCKNCKSSNNIAHARCYKCNYPLHEEVQKASNNDATKALVEAMALAAQDPAILELFMAALSGNKDK
jgi:integrase